MLTLGPTLYTRPRTISPTTPEIKHETSVPITPTPAITPTQICEQVVQLWGWLLSHHNQRVALHEFPKHRLIEFPLEAGYVSFKTVCLISSLLHKSRRGGGAYIVRHDQTSTAPTRYQSLRAGTYHSLVFTVNRDVSTTDVVQPYWNNTEPKNDHEGRETEPAPKHTPNNHTRLSAVGKVIDYCLQSTRTHLMIGDKTREPWLLNQRVSVCGQSGHIRHQLCLRLDTTRPVVVEDSEKRMLGFLGYTMVDHQWLHACELGRRFSPIPSSPQNDVIVSLNLDRSGIMTAATPGVGVDVKFYEDIAPLLRPVSGNDSHKQHASFHVVSD